MTDVYGTYIPRFYVNVFFHALPRTSFCIGGAPADDLVHVIIDHIARSMTEAAQQQQFLQAM